MAWAAELATLANDGEQSTAVFDCFSVESEAQSSTITCVGLMKEHVKRFLSLLSCAPHCWQPDWDEVELTAIGR